MEIWPKPFSTSESASAMPVDFPARGRRWGLLRSFPLDRERRHAEPSGLAAGAGGAKQILTGFNSVFGRPLKVTVTGGGPVGLTFALLLESLIGGEVSIAVYDDRWTQDGGRIVWKGEKQQNARRHQVVTIQSRHYLRLPEDVRARVFQDGHYSEMWPQGPDSIRGCGPRNVRIAHFEDQLLALANEKPGRIQLIPRRFDPEDRHADIRDRHALVICEGAHSSTRDYFEDQFGSGDKSLYSLEGNHVHDVILGVRVKSDLPDPMVVLLTICQNRFLLNTLDGDGFLNMRLTDDEADEAFGIDRHHTDFRDCLESSPCVLELTTQLEECQSARDSTRSVSDLIRERSPLWTRMQGGLKLFGIKEENVSAMKAFRLAMVHRPRFTAQLYPPTQKTSGTFGFLLGDAANAIHFWPGRGLNSGIASAISLARCLTLRWKGKGFRDADFTRHEGLMAMLQYRHKNRAWRAMVTTDDTGTPCAIKNKIKKVLVERANTIVDKDADLNLLMSRLRHIRSRLSRRMRGLPDDDTLRHHLSTLDGETLGALVVSDPWDTVSTGGEEVDVDMLFSQSDPAVPMAS
jgi:2-polyprenyl-6-methoxyphenol hydroxylase-like FAD-dependent oxidoreductase